MANLFNQIGLFGASAAQQLPQQIQPAKLGLLDRLGQRLVPPDSQWKPSDEERKAMVKRGLLEAGLTMLATPTGAGNSPVMGIARGLLAGQQGIRADAEDMRNKALGLDQMRYGNAAPAKVREIQQVAAMLGYKPGSPEFTKYVETQVGLSAKATNMSEWKTSVTQSGEIIRTNEAGGAQILDRNTRQWQDLAGGGEQTPPAGGDKQFVVGFAKDFEDAMGRPPTEQEVAEFTKAVTTGGDYSFTSKPPAPAVPPTTPLAGRPLPSLVNQPAPSASFRTATPAEIKAAGLPDGTSAQVNNATGALSVLNKPLPAQQRQANVDLVKQAAQLPSLLRRVDRVAQASQKLGLPGMDGGPVDQYALRVSESGQELESAVGQLRSMLLPFVRVPGMGSQSDLEARLDGLQYPDASQPPAVRAKNIAELQRFIADLSRVYSSAIRGGSQQPQAPSAEPQRIRIKL